MFGIVYMIVANANLALLQVKFIAHLYVKQRLKFGSQGESAIKCGRTIVAKHVLITVLVQRVGHCRFEGQHQWYAKSLFDVEIGILRAAVTVCL